MRLNHKQYRNIKENVKGKELHSNCRNVTKISNIGIIQSDYRRIWRKIRNFS